MQNTLNYEQIIFRNYISTIIIDVVALIAMIGCIVLVFRSKDLFNKKLLMLVNFICFILIIVILLLSISSLSDAYNDIRNKSYVSVAGTFTVTEPFEIIINRSTASDTKEIIIVHSDGTTEELVLRMNIVSIPDGSYNVTFVYSERTKILLDWDVETE